MTIHQNLIAGEWVGSDAIRNINPSNTNDVVGEYARASVEDTKAAIAAAKAAFPAWSRSGILERHAILRKTADEILARKDELGRLLSREEGKTLAEGIGETVRAGQIFDFFAGKTLRLAGEVMPHRCALTSVSSSPASRPASSYHHAVEFPDRHPRLEDRARAGGRQHRRLQAGLTGAVVRPDARRRLRGGWPP